MLRQVILWLVIIFVIIWIFAAPGAHGSQMHDWINGIATFFRHLAGG